ncbi:MAG: hypothetical protein NXI08_12990 [bacterium]|jgi:hypothetical protein|nr:hypothetical protein [bacterium]
MNKITKLGLLFFALFSTNGLSQSTDFVELKNGTRYEGKVEVKEPFLKKSRIILNDTTTILMQEVEKYQSSEGYFVRMHGGFGDAFARRIQEGNIDLFTRYVPSSGPTWIPGPNGTMTYIGPSSGGSNMQFFSKNDGPIMKANARNLKQELYDNPTSMQYLNQRDGLTALQVIGIVGGVALAASTISAQADKEEPDFTGAVLGLGVVGFSSWIPHFAKQNLTEKAIRAYNSKE